VRPCTTATRLGGKKNCVAVLTINKYIVSISKQYNGISANVVNRSVNASPPSAARATQYTSRAKALCGVLLRHSFLRPKKRCAFFLIGRKKPSFTAGTLSASF